MPEPRNQDVPFNHQIQYMKRLLSKPELKLGALLTHSLSSE